MLEAAAAETAAIGHFLIFRYSDCTVDKSTFSWEGRHLNGSKVQGSTYMQKKTPGSEKT